MTDLYGCQVMVVEDSFLLAMELKAALKDAGAAVIGPFSTVADAQGSLRKRLPHCAVLDVNLGDGESFDVARTLRKRGIPFLFFTGYDASALPTEFAGVERLEKPVDVARLIQAVEKFCRSAPASR